MVTHPSTNRAQHRLTALIETNEITAMPRRRHQVQVQVLDAQVQLL